MTWRESREDEQAEVARRLAAEFGEAPPRPDRGKVLVLDVDGLIRGTAVAQYVLHLEPVEVDAALRAYNTTIFNSLKECVKRLFGGERVTVTAMTKTIERMHSILGFERLGTGTISRLQL